MTLTQGSFKPVKTHPGFIYLARNGNRLGQSRAFLMPFQSPRAKAVRGLADIGSSMALVRPEPDAGDYRKRIAVTLGGAVLIFDALAGGYIDELTVGGSPTLNTHKGWTRGIQASLNFITPNGVACYARTGGSVYSGERGTHTDFTAAGSAPGSSIGTLGSTLATYANHERQGAWMKGLATPSGLVVVETIPIELDPDGYSGGMDHGVRDTPNAGPEPLLPVLYLGLRIVTRYSQVATGIILVEHTIKMVDAATGKPVEEMKVADGWSFEPVRMFLRGAAATTHSFSAGTLLNLGSTAIPGGGGANYSDTGSAYEVTRLTVKRASTTYPSITFLSPAMTVIKELSTHAIGVRLADDGITDANGNRIEATRRMEYSNRTDLSGDVRDGDKHQYIGGRFVFNQRVITDGMKIRAHIAYGANATEVGTRLGAIPDPNFASVLPDSPAIVQPGQEYIA